MYNKIKNPNHCFVLSLPPPPCFKTYFRMTPTPYYSENYLTFELQHRNFGVQIINAMQQINNSIVQFYLFILNGFVSMIIIILQTILIHFL